MADSEIAFLNAVKPNQITAHYLFATDPTARTLVVNHGQEAKNETRLSVSAHPPLMSIKRHVSGSARSSSLEVEVQERMFQSVKVAAQLPPPGRDTLTRTCPPNPHRPQRNCEDAARETEKKSFKAGTESCDKRRIICVFGAK